MIKPQYSNFGISTIFFSLSEVLRFLPYFICLILAEKKKQCHNFVNCLYLENGRHPLFTCRLHIIDAISCPLWLLVLLLQTGYIQVQQSWYDVISSTANMLTCVVCLGIKRTRRNASNMSMTMFVLPLPPLFGTDF